MGLVFAVDVNSMPKRNESAFPTCAKQCASATAPWKPSTVREEWGGTSYDLGPDSLPLPAAEGGEVAGGVNASSVLP